MAKIRKNGPEVALVLSEEEAFQLNIGENTEYELARAKPGVYVLLEKDNGVKQAEKQLQKPNEAQAQVPKLLLDEYNLLRKLDKINYSERIPEHVHKLLTPEEMKVVEKLKEKGLLAIYSGGKYAKTGVYSIPREIYDAVKNGPLPDASPKPEKLSERKSLAWEQHLAKYGYLIVENPEEAKSISEQLNDAIKKGDVIGTRGFDKKYYIAERRFYTEWDSKITPLLKGKEKRIPEICSALRISEVACRVALELMREQGEVLEKKRGTYTGV